MHIEDLDDRDITQLLHFWYRFKLQIPSMTLPEYEKNINILHQKFNRYSILCCNLWLPVTGFHLKSCLNKELFYK